MHEVFPKQQLKHIQAGVEPLLGGGVEASGRLGRIHQVWIP